MGFLYLGTDKKNFQLFRWYEEMRKFVLFYHALLFSIWALSWFKKNKFFIIIFHSVTNSLSLSVSLSQSLSQYIYIYICVCVCAFLWGVWGVLKKSDEEKCWNYKMKHRFTNSMNLISSHHLVVPSAQISLTVSGHLPYRSLLPAGPQGYTHYPHWAALCKFELVALFLLGHVKGSMGVHHLWARLYFFSSVLHVWFV